AAFLAARLAAPAAGVWAETVGRRAGRFLQRPGRWRMVAVGVGDKDVRHLLIGEARKQRRNMVIEIGAGIDHRDFALANDIGAGALIGEGAGIAGDDAAHPWGHCFYSAVFEGDIATIGNLNGHHSSDRSFNEAASAPAPPAEAAEGKRLSPRRR